MNLLDQTEFKAEPPVSQPPQSSIQVERGQDRLVIDMPPAGVWRRAKGMIIISVITCTVAIFSLVLIEQRNLKFSGVGQGFSVVGLLFGVIALLAGVDLGRRSVTLIMEGDRLKITVNGLFGIRHWHWLREQISEIRLRNGEAMMDGSVIGKLQIYPHNNEKVEIVFICSDREIQWLAYELQRALLTFAKVDNGPFLLQPLDSKIKVEQNLKQLVVQVPSQMNKGALFFGTLWCLVMVVVTMQFLMRHHTYGDVSQNKIWTIGGVIILLWLIGLSMIGMVLDSVKRCSALIVENGRLTIASSGLFGTKHWEWSHDKIAEICVAMKPETEVVELKIISNDGNRVGLFSGRDETELEWLAEELSRSLRLLKAN